MEKFEEWLEEFYPMTKYGRNYNKVKALQRVWDHQQAKIDKLEQKSKELKRRLSATREVVSDHLNIGFIGFVDYLVSEKIKRAIND